MKLFGWEITRSKKSLSPPSGTWTTIHDPYMGAWQQDQEVNLHTVMAFSAVFACVRLITADIGKMRLRLEQVGSSGIWSETESAAFSPVLRKPNQIQTRIKFVEQWVTSKLLHGNAFVLKTRDNRGVVQRMQVLDPFKVQPLISDAGEVFYKLKADKTARVVDITVPATEIIHDVHVTPEHPLIGVSPLTAAGLTAAQGMNIQKNSEKFFGNMARPSGMLSAPGAISNDTAARLQQEFNASYSGDNLGKVAVAGDGLKFEAFTISAADSQLIEQLRWTAEDVCRAFGVPPYKVAVGPMPSYNNLPALNQSYFDDCLQELIECIELLILEGLELPGRYRVKFDVDQLLRMDQKTRYESYEVALRSGWKAPNEARASEGLEPVDGGAEPLIQQQNWPLSVLAQRPPPEVQAPQEPQDQTERALRLLNMKSAEHLG